MRGITGDSMESSSWEQCLGHLEQELSAQQFNTWIRPLHAVVDEGELRLLAPNRFVRDWVNEHFADRIIQMVARLNGGESVNVHFDVGTRSRSVAAASPGPAAVSKAASPDHGAAGNRASVPKAASGPVNGRRQGHGLHKQFTFDYFVKGKCNQLACAAAEQVGENPGGAYNPLFLYGGVGLGKTHLMHAAGNIIRQRKPDAKVVYLHSERFVTDMVRALQHNAIDDFKRFYRSVDALLIDDIQFFVGKERSQEEFFHTFNALLEDQQQVILTCDRYPKSVDGLEERLKSRFGWGLTAHIEPPELETRVAILKRKAELVNVKLPDDVSFFIAERVSSNVRELEGALRRVVANSQFTGRPITLEFAREALKDLLKVLDNKISIENIQKTVAEYYKLRVADLVSKRRNRSIARPRQVAMALAKELTEHSLPEIGDSFGGRDHTTVLHGCRKVEELRETDNGIQEDYRILLRTLTS